MIITVVGRKGGSGKSSTALHLGAALNDQAPTIVVDLDAENRTCVDWAALGDLPFLVTDGATFDAQHARGDWTHVVADGYARPTRDQLVTLAEVADVLLVPTMPEAASLRVLARLLPDLRDLPAPYLVTLVAVPPRPSREGERAMRDLIAGGVPTATTTIPRAAAFGRAARSGALAWNMPGGRRLEQRFDALAREVISYAQT